MVEPRHHRQHSFLHTSLRLNGIIEILSIVQKEPMWFSKICKSSRIRLRAAVLKYLKYCEEKKLVHGDEKWLKIRDGRGDRKTVRCLKVYSITIKGEMLLEWLK